MCQIFPANPLSLLSHEPATAKDGKTAKSSSLIPVVNNNFVGGNVIVCQYYALQREKTSPKERLPSNIESLGT